MAVWARRLRVQRFDHDASRSWRQLHSTSPFAPDRRLFLKLSAAAASLAACTPAPDSRKKHVAVIGGGIIGTSIAYHLAKQGARVSLLERGRLAERASRGTFAWINATWAKQPRHYHAFNQSGLSGWKRLQSELDIPVRWGGSLEWFPSAERQARLGEQIAEQVAWGEPAEMIGGERLAGLEPDVDFGAADRVAYSPNDGAVDPVIAVHRLAEAAIRAGAVVRENCVAESVSESARGLSELRTSCGPLLVDTYVLATGADPLATRNLAGLDIPQRTTPGVIVVTKPMPRLVNRIIVAPGVHIHQRDDGRVVLGEQDGAPDTAAHAERLQGRPNRFPAEIFADQHASRIIAIAEQFVPGMRSAEIEDVFIGWRPLPIDGHPVLGRSPNQPRAYLAIMHSGVSLAPIVGQLVAAEIISETSAPDLDAYRPDRAFEAIRRY
ncbi:MAG: FAD-binding oxidoreductase [Pseudomonadota bacterium]|nr:FAD-binding oxidoreductase [Pseudomonadota bacterium]